MTGAPQDARFEDGAEHPLNLGAADAEDLAVLSALLQDAVFAAGDMAYQRRRRRFVVLLNRFRWEDAALDATARPPERVRSLLSIDGVLGAASQGVERSADMVLSLLSLAFEPGAEGAGRLVLTLAGDGAVALEVETLDLRLKDVTRPYLAPSGQRPRHPD